MGEEREVLQLWGACYSGNTDLVETLIEEDVDFLRRDRNGETVLHMAARADNPDVVNVLLDHLDPDVCNHNDQTPLHLATSKGHIKVIEVLILADSDLNRKTKYSQMTALHMACQDDRGDVVSALLEGGAWCNLTDAIGKPPPFYTTDPGVHQLFTAHAKVCNHDDINSTRTSTNSTSPQKSHTSDDATSLKKSDISGGNASPTKTDDKSQSERHKMKWNKTSRNAKKVKVNHGLGFSEEHKQRMQQDVFSRLMGKKTK